MVCGRASGTCRSCEMASAEDAVVLLGDVELTSSVEVVVHMQ